MTATNDLGDAETLDPVLGEYIGRMNQVEIATTLRFAAPGHALVTGAAGDLLLSRFAALGGWNPALSRSIGWDAYSSMVVQMSAAPPSLELWRGEVVKNGAHAVFYDEGWRHAMMVDLTPARRRELFGVATSGYFMAHVARRTKLLEIGARLEPCDWPDPRW